MPTVLPDGLLLPKIYAYTTEEDQNTAWRGTRRGSGLFKVGFTQRAVEVRLREQLAPVRKPTESKALELVVEAAITDDGRVLRDGDVHRMLERMGVYRAGGEWFECTREEVLQAIEAVRRGVDGPRQSTHNYALRPEQREAVRRTADYFRMHSRTREGQAPHFLWNAKMRFGKTFTSYQLAMEMGWTRVLVLTYKPAVEQTWRTDLLEHQDFRIWKFYGLNDPPPNPDDPKPFVRFASFQGVRARNGDGGISDRLTTLRDVHWDVVIVDEYHFGAWRDAARAIYQGEYDEDSEVKTEGDKSELSATEAPDLEEGFATDLETEVAQVLMVGNYLYLSGTPFRALANGEFLEDQIYNWTYADEQRAKRDWKGYNNPYTSLPQMHLLAYEMPEALRDVALNQFSEFSLTEFFRTELKGGTPVFVHEGAVQRWLNLLRGEDVSVMWRDVSDRNRPPLPFEDVKLLTALQHTVWYLPRVDACLAMRNLLGRQYNQVFFSDYSVVVSAGTAAGQGLEALLPVQDAITNIPQNTKSITLTCGKLLTGVTVPAWTGIFMLRELKSPETYFQAAFRVQSSWKYQAVDMDHGGDIEIVVKEHCFVFDFSLNRALKLIADYALELAPGGREADPEEALKEFMEFLPVLSFKDFSMEQLRASDVLDFLARGTSPSMLARRWNSSELISLDIRSMEALLADQQLLESLGRIDAFANLKENLSTVISSHQELRPKRLAGAHPTEEEKRRKKNAAERRTDVKKTLKNFVARIPIFMYLTDDRERSVTDIIRQVEPELFEKVATLSLRDFERLMALGVFSRSKMNGAVWDFRRFEDPSLGYIRPYEQGMVGGWDAGRSDRLARLIEAEDLGPGDTLVNIGESAPVFATITDDFGISVAGIRFDGPSSAAQSVTGDSETDGWSYWTLVWDGEPVMTLAEMYEKYRNTREN